MADMKCNACDKEFGEDQFPILRNGNISKSCKNCIEQRKQYYRDNREKLIEYRKNYDKENNEVVLSTHKKYYEKHKEEILQKKKEYHIKNKENIKKKSKEYYYANRERILLEKKEYVKLHKEERKKYDYNRNINNLEENLYTRAKTRAIRKNLPFDLKLEDIIISKCECCGIELVANIGKSIPAKSSPSIDRVIPEKGYIKENIKVICYYCNLVKGNGAADLHNKICNYIKNPLFYPEQFIETRVVSKKEYLLYQSAKTRAKKKGIECNIQKYNIFIPEVCQICNCKIEVGIGKWHDQSPTVDRIDLNKGYIAGNVVIICYHCNNIKNCGTAEDHEKITKYIENSLDWLSSHDKII